MRVRGMGTEGQGLAQQLRELRRRAEASGPVCEGLPALPTMPCLVTVPTSVPAFPLLEPLHPFAACTGSLLSVLPLPPPSHHLKAPASRPRHRGHSSNDALLPATLTPLAPNPCP